MLHKEVESQKRYILTDQKGNLFKGEKILENSVKVHQQPRKLDGSGPVDNRPSTDYLHKFF